MSGTSYSAREHLACISRYLVRFMRRRASRFRSPNLQLNCACVRHRPLLKALSVTRRPLRGPEHARRWASRMLAALTLARSTVLLAQEPPPVHPPVVKTRVDASVPTSLPTLNQGRRVVLAVTVDVSGHVGSVEVRQSASPELDEAAARAVRLWTFEPALRGTTPVASRVLVPFDFSPPTHPAMTTPPSAPHITESGGPKADAPAGRAGKSAEPHGAPGNAAAPASTPSASSTTEPSEETTEVVVRGSFQSQSHGASDYQVPVGLLRVVPRKNASEYLKLAPGILLANEGGEGHADQVFLRGFDAREGQDIEFSVDGVPINDSGNLHGNGYADTHFIIPETIRALRVVEGPFSPYQGNYAVAGSADYQLGVEERGSTAKITFGSWDTKRVLLLWAPPGQSVGTFGAVEAYSTQGFGMNRAATRASAIGQYEIDLGHGAGLRVTGQAYATHFLTAGVVSEDDYSSGKVGFYGTEDPLQGGDASRFSLAATYEKSSPDSTLQQSLFLIRRDMRLREDFTGFLLDTQDALDTLHDQRGDLIDMNYDAWTLGGRGLWRGSTKLFGLAQALELGYFARIDATDSTQYRNTVPGDIPYRLDDDYQSTLTDIGLFADASLRPFRWLTFRGGARLDSFLYNVLNGCAAQGDFEHPSPSRPPTNESCHDQMLNGAHREPVQRASTGAAKAMPRVTALFGPFRHFTLSASYGEGVRSIDPNYIAQNLDTPFASVRAYEGGVSYASALGALQISARSVFFETKVDKDLVFSETAGRNVLANGTTRTGWTGSVRVAGPFFDEAANVTLVRPTFDDTHLELPYVPTLVVREDAAAFTTLPWKPWGHAARATAGIGYTFVGPRALPYNQQSDLISVVDLSAALHYRAIELSLAVTNLFDTRYRLGEYNYASDFHTEPEPTLVAGRQFTAGAPRGIFLSLAATLGGDT